MRLFGFISSLLILAACGSSEAPPPKSADDIADAAFDGPPEPAPAVASLIPECKGSEDGCLPPSHWVDKMCSGVHPEVALHMFRGGSPYKRVYSKFRAPAYNGTGGPSVTDDRVEKGEELIALRRNSDGRGSSAGEMSVGETSGYDLLRWNGSCVTMHDGEYSEKAPRRRVHARGEWRWLGDGIQSALQTDGTVKEAYVARRKECKGASVGRVTKKCVEYENTLVSAIVNYVRNGGELPEPNERL